jgi:uncharacterized Rmd1/YagE family protein
MNNKLKPGKPADEDVEKQIRRIHRLAERLPWIVVFFVALAAIISVLEVYFSH